MKILFVTHWANNMLIFRTWMMQEAVRRGHDVVVLCPNDKDTARFAELGVRHIPWRLKRGAGFINLIAALWDARRIILREKPDSTVVYCVQPILAILLAWKLGGRNGKLFPTFTGLGSLWTDLDEPTFKKRMLRALVERAFGFLLPQSDAVFVLNRDDQAQVASWNPRRLVASSEPIPQRSESRRIPIIQTRGEGVDLDYFKPATPEEKLRARTQWGIPHNARVIGFVGRLIREKGAQDFLKLCEELHSDESTHFLVVGDPDPGNPTSLTLAELHMLDAVPRMHREPWMNDVRPAYAAMDVLVFLSAREGLPITPLEAMACGVPVVAYDAVGTRETPIGDWLVSQGDRKSIAQKILEMDLKEMSVRPSADKFGIHATASIFLDAVEGLVSP